MNFLTCGVHKSGASVEGLGKNQMDSRHLIPMQKRGANLLQHPHLVNHYREFFLSAMQPFGGTARGGGFSGFDDWGGSKMTMRIEQLLAKYAFPEDALIDFLWQQAMPDAVSYTHLTLPTNREV